MTTILEKAAEFYRAQVIQRTLADLARQYDIPAATLHGARKAGRLLCTRRGRGAHSDWLVDPDSFVAWHATYKARPRRPKPEPPEFPEHDWQGVEAAALEERLRDEWQEATEGRHYDPEGEE